MRQSKDKKIWYKLIVKMLVFKCQMKPCMKSNKTMQKNLVLKSQMKPCIKPTLQKRLARV